jgi:hypothetical protein
MEMRFGQDFSDIRIHTDAAATASARLLNARAYTVGRHVVLPTVAFGADGDRLLAHELSHVIQQSDVPRGAPLPTTVEPADATAEDDARAVADGGDASRLVPTGPAARLHRQPLDPSHEGAVTSAGNQPDAPWVGMRAAEWVEQHKTLVSERVTELLGATSFDVTRFGANWTGTGNAAFVGALARNLLTPGALWWQLTRVLGRDALVRAVDAGRDAYPSHHGSPDWAPGVPPEITSRLSVRINESLSRVIDRVAAYELSVWNASQKGPTQKGPTPTPKPGLSLAPAPAVQPLVAGAFPHPLDPYVLSALASNLAFDWTRWLSLVGTPGGYDPERRLRPVRFQFEAIHGAPNWLRVIDPVDATPVEVAQELFGDPTQAYRLTVVHPLYGFRESDVGAGAPHFLAVPDPDFRPQHHAAYTAALARRPVTPQPRQPVSPAQELLYGPLADEAALKGSSGVRGAPGVSAAAVRQRLTLITDRFAQILALTPALAQAPADPAWIFTIAPGGMTRSPFVSPTGREWELRLKGAAARVRSRFERLVGTSDERDVLLWDPQSTGQLEIVNAAHAGLSVAAALAHEYRDQPRIHEVIVDVASRYVAAAEISDIYGPAYEQLMAADRQSRLFPVTAMELILAELRAALDASRMSKWDPKDPNASRYGLADLDRTEQELRERLARIRPLLLSAPDQAKEELQNISRQLLGLQTGVGLVGNLDAIDSVLRALMDSLSFTGELRSWFGHYGNDKIEDAVNGALKLHQEWQDIYTIWVQDKDSGRRLLAEKAKTKQWRDWFEDMRVLIRDQQQADRWTTFGLMIGIALVTAGIGAYVGAAAGAAWGSTAGFVAATAAEAITFTSLSYVLIDKDPSVSGFFKQLGLNLLTFGVLRGVSMGYRGILGARAATAGGKLGEIAVSYAALNGIALFQANLEKQQQHGQSLTQDEIVSISLENLAFAGAMTLGTFLLKSPLSKLSLSGELAGANLRVRRAIAAVESHLGTARALEAAGKPVPTRSRDALVKAEEAYVAAERDLLQALGKSVRYADKLGPAKQQKVLKQLGIPETVAQAVRTGEVGQQLTAYVEALTAVKVQRALVPAGGGDFLVPGTQYDMVIEYFRSQGARVTGGDSPFAGGIAHPGGVSTGLRSAVVEVQGAPTMTIKESAAVEPRTVATSVELLEGPFALSARQTRMRSIARLILANKEFITRPDARAKQAREAAAALKDLRTSFHAKPGDPPPPLEGYVPDFVLRENIEAVGRLRTKLAQDNPDAIVGMERYGALLADVLTHGIPSL